MSLEHLKSDDITDFDSLREWIKENGEYAVDEYADSIRGQILVQDWCASRDIPDGFSNIDYTYRLKTVKSTGKVTDEGILADYTETPQAVWYWNIRGE